MSEATQARERGIIMSAESVRKILAGEKTQHRFTWRKQPLEVFCPGVNSARGAFWPTRWKERHSLKSVYCPYGGAGDFLFAKEVWFLPTMFRIPAGNWKRGGLAYVGYPDAPESNRIDIDRELYRTITSMEAGQHSASSMPRWASRLTLEIKSVKVERLNAITERDADAEGTTSHYACEEPTATREGVHRCTPVQDFARSWDTINGKRPGCAWKDNPWVWCVSFAVLASPAAGTSSPALARVAEGEGK